MNSKPDGHQHHRRPRTWAVTTVSAACLGLATASISGPSGAAGTQVEQPRATATPIKHLVVVFDENISFDHYFGTYPHATNADGHPFHAKPGTPTVNGLTRALLKHNPNAHNPQRLARNHAYTCDQNHEYDAEQKAFNGGLMNKFVEFTAGTDCAASQYDAPGLVMDYFDGNTVTAMWNYAQRFAMSDNSYGTNFGPSTPGAINLISGNTHGAVAIDKQGRRVVDLAEIASPNKRKVGTLVKDPDPDPMYDDCSGTGEFHAFFLGRNVGDLLNAKHVTWGWFQGGFRPTARDGGVATCGSSHVNIGGDRVTDYSPHHEPFQYYRSTANPHHLPPSSVSAIGHTDRANHQYDLRDFYRTVRAGNLPAVSFLKARAFQDGHAGYSDPIDEQHFLVTVLNRVQRSPQWRSTAVVIAYDDSDGWYDHQMSPILNPSSDPRQDWLNGQGHCGSGQPLGGFQDRCGYGPRLPMLALSPYSRVNSVDSALTDQTSVLRFIEDNWQLGRIGGGSFDRLAGSMDGLFDWHNPHFAPFILNRWTGEPVVR